MVDHQWINKVEMAAMNAWAAPCQMAYDGWFLRITGGDSKRVNSVNVQRQSTLLLDEKIKTCEGVYQRFGRPTLFRLPEPFNSPGLCNALAAAGYSSFDPTYVMGREIDSAAPLPDGVTLREMDCQEWLQFYSFVSGKPLSRLVYHARVLNVIVPEKVLMGLYIHEEPAACGMGVVEGELLGYFSIYTHHKVRRQGYATWMMGALSRWGEEKGAKYGYLQVEAHNTQAIALYEKLGFERLYTYMYYKRA